METAKVDIRKLQLLNDRINQCIDALNQVRLSVHGLTASPGLSHSSQGIFGGVNPAAYGLAGGQFPFGQQQGIGLSHTGGIGSPFAGIGNPYAGIGNPFGAAAPGLNPQFGPFGQTPGVGSPFVPQGMPFPQGVPGLSHTSAPWAQTPGFGPGISPTPGIGYNEGLQDALLTARISQTFPYAQFPVPPVVSLY